jgi:hypothetical protein
MVFAGSPSSEATELCDALRDLVERGRSALMEGGDPFRDIEGKLIADGDRRVFRSTSLPAEAALALVSALGFGLLPAVRAVGGGSLGVMRGDPRLPGGVRSRSWSALVVAQVAVAVVLLAG